MAIERPSTQANGLHQTIHANTGKPFFFSQGRAALQELISGLLLVTD